MELNTEINKVFGTEMAKLFASTISEEEILKHAQSAWDKIAKVQVDSYGRRKNPEIENYIRNEFVAALHNKVLEILKEPENEEVIEQHARELVNKAKQIADEAIVKAVAEGITTRTLSVYNTHEKFVMDVLTVLNTESEKRRPY